MQKRMTIAFKELTITCDGHATHIVADGDDLSTRCSKVIFEHDVKRGENYIRLETEIELAPENYTGSAETKPV